MVRLVGNSGLVAMLFMAIALPVSAQDSVAGTWLFTMSGPDGSDMEIPFTFEQDGTAVAGSVDLSGIPEVEGAELSDGLYEDQILSFLIHVSGQGMTMTIEVEGDVDGDEMVGEVYMAEMGQAMPFTAKRADG